MKCVGTYERLGREDADIEMAIREPQKQVDELTLRTAIAEASDDVNDA